MVKRLQNHIAEKRVSNIRILPLDWEDLSDEAIGEHDLIIASTVSGSMRTCRCCRGLALGLKTQEHDGAIMAYLERRGRLDGERVILEDDTVHVKMSWRTDRSMSSP